LRKLRLHTSSTGNLHQQRDAALRSGEMILRWTYAAMHEAEKNFRRVQGYKGLSVLLTALQKKR
jgi:hypothetical protein